MKQLLFVCSANKDRSKSAEDHFSSVYLDINIESCGTNQKICNQLGTTYINEELVANASSIFVMEPKHKKAIETLFGKTYTQKIKVLHIKDIYEYGDKALISVLEEKMEGYL